ncbi:MAG: hypothetical protein ACHP8B_13640, partial [Terriglobales bacterium]
MCSRVLFGALTLCLLASVVRAQTPAPAVPANDAMAPPIPNPAPAANLKEYSVPAGAILRMELSGPVNVSHLK